jgi:hypothetical protein
MKPADTAGAGVTATHEEKNTFAVDVFIPGHAPRITSALFTRTRLQLLQRTGQRCYVCHCTAEETGHPLEAHHYPIERAFAEMIDFGPGSVLRRDFPNFDWAHFDAQQPMDPYLFVDDMTVNGLPLCKPHHIGKDEGIHTLPHPVWLAQRYGCEGYRFSAIETIHHSQGE